MAGRAVCGPRSAERPSKSVGFHVTGGRWYDVTRSEGGVLHGFRLRSTTATFVYMTHSAVVSQFENALPRPRGRMMARTRATPPKPGGHVTLIAVLSYIPLSRPHGVALVLIYPCGKAWNRPPFPSRFIVSDRSSPSRVRCAASRPGRLRADPKDALLTRGKGGSAERGGIPNSRRIERVASA